MLRAQSLRCALCALALAAYDVGAAARAQAAEVASCDFSTALVRQVTPSGGLKLRDTIEIVMTDDSLIKEAACRKKKVVLFLNGQPLKDVVAFPPTDPRKYSLQFPLTRTEASREVWTGVLGRPKQFTTPVRVSVGLEDQYPIEAEPGSKKTVDLTIIPVGWLAGWVVLLIVLGGGFLMLARTTDILRDDGPLPGEGKRRPYSLARTQASWWFFIVLAAYLFIGMITGDFSTSITGTVLVLTGIGAGTVVGSAFVDASKSNPETASREIAAKGSLAADMLQLEGEIAAGQKAIEDESKQAEGGSEAAMASAAASVAKTAQAVAEQTAELAEKRSQWRKLCNENEHFIRDVLSDANGVNFHRFQMLAWTVVLGIIFIGHVYKEMAMPEFSETLLSLMGISAGTYIGLKIPEPTVPKTQV
ncbi:MAG TPA: hypothetical protein VFS60_01820 [Thermoanaerobaculia bacterium]|nr:hypothetical protein [Thermoanaerobaculia bacterium]